MKPSHLHDDLKSEVVVELMMLPVERLMAMRERGELIYFAVKIVKNFVTGGHSKFNRTYRRTFVDTVPENLPDHGLNGRVVKEKDEEPILEMLLRIKKLAYQKNPTYIHELLDNVGWYKQYMISLYMKLGSYDLMSQETGIPKFSCFDSVRQGLRGLQKHFGLNHTYTTNNKKRLTIKKCLTAALTY